MRPVQRGVAAVSPNFYNLFTSLIEPVIYIREGVIIALLAGLCVRFPACADRRSIDIADTSEWLVCSLFFSWRKVVVMHRPECAVVKLMN
ncbi:MAG: hypothetical protein ACI8Z1_002760 [Candidatus Azotimanducaceae bacterium]|jgi:hypothetical protein